VTLTNINETSPGSVDILVVSPAQADTLLMANAGGQNNIKLVTLKFDDAALTNLPESGQIMTGTNLPSAYLSVPPFP